MAYIWNIPVSETQWNHKEEPRSKASQGSSSSGHEKPWVKKADLTQSQHQGLQRCSCYCVHALILEGFIYAVVFMLFSKPQRYNRVGSVSVFEEKRSKRSKRLCCIFRHRMALLMATFPWAVKSWTAVTCSKGKAVHFPAEYVTQRRTSKQEESITRETVDSEEGQTQRERWKERRNITKRAAAWSLLKDFYYRQISWLVIFIYRDVLNPTDPPEPNCSNPPLF